MDFIKDQIALGDSFSDLRRGSAFSSPFVSNLPSGVNSDEEPYLHELKLPESFNESPIPSVGI
jgi:hypothetical protein